MESTADPEADVIYTLCHQPGATDLGPRTHPLSILVGQSIQAHCHHARLLTTAPAHAAHVICAICAAPPQAPHHLTLHLMYNYLST